MAEQQDITPDQIKRIKIMIPYPEKHVFENESSDITEHLTKASPQPVFQITEVKYPSEEEGGGMYIYYEGVPHPAKGFPFPEACHANNFAKRLLVSQLRFITKNFIVLFSLLSVKRFESWLREYCSTAAEVLGPYILKDFRYTVFCRELRKFVTEFLSQLGMSKDVKNYSKILITLIEYDNAYLFMMQDLFTETTMEALKKNPKKEILRLLAIFRLRRLNSVKMTKLARMLEFITLLIFYIPKVNKSFKKALNVIDFKKLQRDEIDNYNILRWDIYNFNGKTFEERILKYMDIHEGKPPPMMIIGG